MPGFNTGFNRSDTIVTVLPLTNGQQSNLALHSKMLLALLNPLLDCEQLRALKLTQSEASTLVSLLNQAVEDPYHLAQDSTLLSLLKAVIWFTHEYNRQDDIIGKTCSEFESKLGSVAHELKLNLQLLVDEGILSALKPVLKLNGQEELQASAARLFWNLAHNTSVKKQILNDTDIVGALQDIHILPSPKLNVASHCALWLFGSLTDGTYNYTHVE